MKMVSKLLGSMQDPPALIILRCLQVMQQTHMGVITCRAYQVQVASGGIGIQVLL